MYLYLVRKNASKSVLVDAEQTMAEVQADVHSVVQEFIAAQVPNKALISEVNSQTP
jgi:thymidylate kinase